MHKGVGGYPPHPTQDLDWDRWFFCAALASLFAVHCQLRDDWARQGICIKASVHHQCYERYVPARDGAVASVQYSYNGKLKVMCPGVAAGLHMLRLPSFHAQDRRFCNPHWSSAWNTVLNTSR